MKRREFLRYSVPTAVAASLAGCPSDDEPDETDAPPTETPGPGPDETATPSGTATGTPEATEASRYDEVVDVAEAGADTNGEEPINSVVEEHAGDDTLLLFPDGEYLIDRLDLADFTNFGLAAVDGEDPILKPARPAKEFNHIFLWFRGMDEFVLSGFDFDFREDGLGGAIQITHAGSFTARELEVHGKMPDKSNPQNPATFRFDVTDEGGSGLVENVVAADGGHDGGNAIGLYVGKDHAGELTFRDCEIQNFPNNGLYASSPGRQLPDFSGGGGEVHVEGGLYKNNNIANVRLGTTGSSARGVRVVVDKQPPSPQGALNARGIRIRNQSDQVVENCEIEIGPDAAPSFGALVIHRATTRVTVRNTTIKIDRDGIHAVNALPPTETDEETGSVFENVEIVGSAAAGRAVALKGRDAGEIRNCTIHQEGEQRDGVLVKDVEECLVADSTIDVTGEPIQTVNAAIQTENLNYDLTNVGEGANASRDGNDGR